MKRFLALSLLSFSHIASPCSGYFPPNDLDIPSTITDGGLTRQKYDAVLNKMTAIFEPIVTAAGAELFINRAWHRGTVNASTTRDGNRWTINFYGGMARHKYMTEDAYALVYCHELGHHLGGAPKKNRGTFWSSTEGQADYWGTLKCLRRVFDKEDNVAAIQNMDIPAEVSKKCARNYRDKKTTAMCKRMALAAHILGKMHADIRNHEAEPLFETPDTFVVNRTNESHPLPQCRLDTHFQGALCDLHWRNDVSQADEVVGSCHSVEGYQTGIRPLCWFKPGL